MMLYVDQVAAYFRDLVDEPDQGFMTDGIAQTWLQIGFDQYYNYMTSMDPERFISSHSMTLANAFEFDLAGVLQGAAAPNRMLQLVRVCRIEQVTLRPNQYLYPVASREQLDSLAEGYNMVLLSAAKIFFSMELTGPYRIDYIPVSTVDWSKTTSGDNEFIDDLIVFHDMIALYAALQYYASAGYSNPQVEQLLMVRQQAFKSHLQRGRSINAARYVQFDNPYGW